MGGAVVDGRLGITGGHQPVYQSGREGVSAAYPVQDLQVVVRLGHVDLPQKEMTNLLGNGDVVITIAED